jgi:hypothetical protein
MRKRKGKSLFDQIVDFLQVKQYIKILSLFKYIHMKYSNSVIAVISGIILGIVVGVFVCKLQIHSMICKLFKNVQEANL